MSNGLSQMSYPRMRENAPGFGSLRARRSIADFLLQCRLFFADHRQSFSFLYAVTYSIRRSWFPSRATGYTQLSRSCLLFSC